MILVNLLFCYEFILQMKPFCCNSFVSIDAIWRYSLSVFRAVALIRDKDRIINRLKNKVNFLKNFFCVGPFGSSFIIVISYVLRFEFMTTIFFDNSYANL